MCTLIVLFLAQPAFTKKNLQTKDLCHVNSVIITIIDHELRHNRIEKRYLHGGNKSKGVALPFLLPAACLEQVRDDHPEVLMCMLGGRGWEHALA